MAKERIERDRPQLNAGTIGHIDHGKTRRPEAVTEVLAEKDSGQSRSFEEIGNAPEEYLGDVMGNLNSRRGRVESLEPLGNAQVVKASVPLSEMFGYATDLRSMTQGRVEFTMQFDRYDEVPQSIAAELTEAQT